MLRVSLAFSRSVQLQRPLSRIVSPQHLPFLHDVFGSSSGHRAESARAGAARRRSGVPPPRARPGRLARRSRTATTRARENPGNGCVSQSEIYALPHNKRVEIPTRTPHYGFIYPCPAAQLSMASPLAAASVFARRFCAPSGAGGGLRMLPSGSRAPRLPLAWPLADPPPAATSRNPLTHPRQGHAPHRHCRSASPQPQPSPRSRRAMPPPSTSTPNT